MKSKFYTFTFYLLSLTFPVVCIHFLTCEFLMPELDFFYNMYGLYFFHVISTLATYSFLLFVNKTFFDKTGFAFLATGVFKMFACIVFLIPLIQSDFDNKIPDVLAFFMLYFIYLLYETIHAIKLLKP